MTRDEARRTARELNKLNETEAFRVGLALVKADYPELLLPAATKLARKHPRSPRLQQLLGLAARGADDSRTALRAFERAARLAPSDALVAHSHARAALDLGEPAVELFDRAARLAPADGSILLGRAAALTQKGEGLRAAQDLSAILVRNPRWIEGHRGAAQIRGQHGEDILQTVDAALRTAPQAPELHHLKISLLLEANEPDRAAQAAASAGAAVPSPPAWLGPLSAHIASERGQVEEADRLFAGGRGRQTLSDISLFARHLIRAGRPGDALSLLEPLMAQDHERLLWPYLSLVYRILDDPRQEWLDRREGLVGVYDIGSEVGDLEALADTLRQLHFATSPPLDQSVRGGTQTDGNLLLRGEMPLQKARRAILRTVARHAKQMPGFEPGHPTLLKHRDPLRIAGSWSVRLQDAGFHTDHVHSQGWISSAFYVSLPETLDKGGDHAGWLSLGESRDLVPGLSPLHLIEPRPGRLVLFPSTMWHGTRPFTQGERLTIAFDISRPKQS